MPAKYRANCELPGCHRVFHTRDPRQRTCCLSHGAKLRVLEKGKGGLRPDNRRGRRRELPVDDSVPYESPEHVDALFDQVRAARRHRERMTGQSGVDGWAQRPGRSTTDGELRVLEVTP